MTTTRDTASRSDHSQRLDGLLDDKSWEHLGITGQEFRRRWYAGEYRSDSRPVIIALDHLMRTGHWGDPGQPAER